MPKKVLERTYKTNAIEIDLDAFVRFIEENKDRMSGYIESDGGMDDGSDFIVYRMFIAPKTEKQVPEEGKERVEP